MCRCDGNRELRLDCRYSVVQMGTKRCTKCGIRENGEAIRHVMRIAESVTG